MIEIVGSFTEIHKGDTVKPSTDGYFMTPGGNEERHIIAHKMYRVEHVEKKPYGFAFIIYDEQGDKAVCSFPGKCAQLNYVGSWEKVERRY